MLSSSYSSGIPEDPVDSHQIELPIKLETTTSSKLYDILQDQSKKINEIQDALEYSSLVNMKVFNILYKQQELNPVEAIKATKQEVATLNQGVTSLGQGVWKIYQHLEKDSIGKELKSGQQNLQKTIEANSQKKNTANIGYLDWKQIASIITATAIVSSLCSLAVFQIAANWKTDRTPTPIEKPLKPKKTAR